jgi:S-DNA-T family DNA segregation ATPase FtsK/SpoIIIE
MSFSVKLPAYERSKNKWMSNLNHDVGLYFCTRYRGLEDLTRSVIEWDTGYLFTYDALLNNYRNQHKDSYSKNRSTSREATQLKFLIALSYKVGGRIEQATIQLIWKCNPNAIGMELHDDLRRLASKPFLLTTVNREPVSKKGHLQEIALDDIDTFDAAYSQDRGSLISAITKAVDITKIFPGKLQEAVKDGRITLAGRDEIKAAWEHFTEIYGQAITHFLSGDGLASDYLLEQADAYNILLQTLREYASGDKNRVDLWHPLLRLGVVSVLGNKPAAIIAPWQPLRLFALTIKARQFARFVSYICKNTAVDLGDDRLFFFHLKSDMEHPYYPEVSIGFQGEQPKLLSLSDTVNDYSLMEIPLREGNEQTTNENPREAAEKVGEVVRRYLDLQPHKKASLSIALYNCDSKGLPEAVVGKLANLYETKSSNEVCCQIVLRHQHMPQLSKLYEKMVEAAETHPEAFIASESENDFMSRLRIGIMATDVDNITNAQEKKTDIVFLQDVISRQAQIIWLENVTDQHFPDPLQHFPARWSRRHPTAYGDLRSAVYLVCPSQPLVGQTYLDALHDTVAEQLRPGEHVLPARQVSFQDASTQRIFQEVHQLGEWVVNYDDLLERRLLQHQKVTVIKYQQNRAQDRNLIISSTSSFQLLQVLVRQRLEKLNLPSEPGTEAIAHKCIEQAKSISGDIVLRAARRGVHASELIGLVLSQHLLSSEIQDEDPVGWFFLDDYANWLGQDEQQIADIMALVLEEREQRRVLKIIISEAKYIEGNIAETRKTSQKQLKETVKRIQDALFKDPGSLDRDVWLARLSDLLIDGVVVNSRQRINLRQWANLLRRGEILLEVKGYSHVFAPFMDTQTLYEDTQMMLVGVQNCFQETFGHKEVQELVQCFARGKSALPIRESLGDEKPWRTQHLQLPGRDQLWMAISPTRQPSEQQIAEQNHYPPTSHETEFADDQSLGQKSPASNGSSSLPEQETVTHSAQTDRWVKDTVETLKRALRSYELQTNVLGTRLTPNALLIRLKGSDRLRVEDIEKKQSVLLTTHSLKLLHIIAQPGEIVVSIERKQREIVSLREVWKQRTIFAQPGEMNFCYVVGIKELDGEILYLNVGQKTEHIPIQAPHTLIAGTTGSGKSVLMQNLLLDICRTNTPAQARIYLIDPKKGVDYHQLLNLPHLYEGIITEQNKAQEILTSLVAQMDYRYTLFAQAKVNSLVDYNRRVAPQDQLPMLWLVHDEFAEWMLVRDYKEAVSASVQRLGSKARAAGIHLIFAAQRPDANVLPLQLRDNLGNRLILQVASTGTSEIALGEKGAEKLLGKGHVAAKVNNEIILAQVPYLSLEEQNQIVEEICQHERQDTPHLL